jgi:hypothetical protein
VNYDPSGSHVAFVYMRELQVGTNGWPLNFVDVENRVVFFDPISHEDL